MTNNDDGGTSTRAIPEKVHRGVKACSEPRYPAGDDAPMHDVDLLTTQVGDELLRLTLRESSEKRGAVTHVYISRAAPWSLIELVEEHTDPDVHVDFC